MNSRFAIKVKTITAIVRGDKQNGIVTLSKKCFREYKKKLISRNKSTPRRCWLTCKTQKLFTNKSDLKYRHIISCSNSASQSLEIKLNKVLNEINQKSKFNLNSLGTLKTDLKMYEKSKKIVS